MTASRADRIEAQITRLAELVTKIEGTDHILEVAFNAGLEAGRERLLRGALRPSTPRKPRANSHLRVVRLRTLETRAVNLGVEP